MLLKESGHYNEIHTAFGSEHRVVKFIAPKGPFKPRSNILAVVISLFLIYIVEDHWIYILNSNMAEQQ
jgi:hypothetical protein